MAKFKTIAIIVLGALVVVLTMGLWDPFNFFEEKKKIKDKEDYEKDRENEKIKAELETKDKIVELATTKSGPNRDIKLKSILDEDYPGSK